MHKKFLAVMVIGVAFVSLNKNIFALPLSQFTAEKFVDRLNVVPLSNIVDFRSTEVEGFSSVELLDLLEELAMGALDLTIATFEAEDAFEETPGEVLFVDGADENNFETDSLARVAISGAVTSLTNIDTLLAVDDFIATDNEASIVVNGMNISENAVSEMDIIEAVTIENNRIEELNNNLTDVDNLLAVDTDEVFFEVQIDIPDEVVETMLGKSLPTVEFAQTLSLVTVTYIDYDGNIKNGDLVVHKDLADEVAEIFQEIFEAGFPIANINLVDVYDADDNLSMVNNNTSAFNYRLIFGTTSLSNHSYGRSIDVNPLVNPHVINGVAYPIEGNFYIDRTVDAPGLIREGDVVYNAFVSRGWSWGGHWSNPDYQHFEK